MFKVDVLSKERGCYEQGGISLRMLAVGEVTIRTSQSERKDPFFQIFLSGPRCRGFRNIPLSPNHAGQSKSFDLRTHEFLIHAQR